MRNLWITTLFAAMTAVSPLSLHGQDKVQSSAAPTLKMTPEGRQALAEARAVAERVKGLEGEEREAALASAAQAYESVASSHASDKAACAQANFEAGELWRRHGSLSVAEEAYARAAELDANRYAERGLIQVAHMRRRQGQVEEAHGVYVTVATIKPASSRAHEARLWVGRTLESLDRREEAIAAYRKAVDAAAGPRQAIEACNWLAKALVTAGDLPGAEAAIGRADQAVQAVPAEQRSAAVTKALAEMSARRALQRAKDKKSDAHKDARRLEKKRGGP